MMSELALLLQDLRDEVDPPSASGVASVGVPGVLHFWNDASTPRSPLLYDSGLVIVAQGRKVGYLAGRRIEYGANTCLVLGVPVAFECEVDASPEAPLLGLRVDIDVTRLHALVGRFAGELGLDERDSAATLGVEPVPLEGALLAAAVRLLEAARDPLDRQIVGPAALEELIYRVLRSPQGRVLYRLTQQHTAYASISRALTRIHADYRRAISVEALAKTSGMGVSAFHRAFKQVTGETPVQYLKKLRLLKAKGLLVFEGARVDEAAYDVGYASPSQFSRDFKRYFDVPPSQARRLPYNDPVRTESAGAR